MITAEEARRITMEAKSDVYKIEKMILKKAKDGAFECYVGHSISHDTESELVLKGFTVERRAPTCTIIKWSIE